MDNLKGRTVKGYELQHLIGSGGFGAVYRAHQVIVEREVAIKVILPHHANDPQFIRTFEAEAHLIARLEHPFIVPLYDFWRDPEGAYLVMRYYQSGNLSQLIHQGGALDLETVARMLEQIASALDAAHNTNIIHRDIKPANILLDSSGNAYLSDFGLAEDIANGADSVGMAGSPAYLSPEAIRSESPGYLSDLYSLGFVLYEMLTGKYAFAEITPDSSIMSILDFHLNETIPDAIELSDEINLVVQRATAKDPEDRYPNAIAMATAFRQAIQDEGIDTPAVIMIASEYMANPYKGLRAFDEADEFTFFGRDKLVKQLLNRLSDDSENSNFLALVGPSGSGKSSVVHAGLVPAIRRGELQDSQDWFILDMVPGVNPFGQLVSTLRSIALDPLAGAERTLKQSPDTFEKMLLKVLPTPNDKLMLVIDQFEELFTQNDDIELRRQFLDLLYTALQSERFYLAIILRADFYDRPMMHEGFGRLIQERTQVVLPLTSMELQNVVTGPATYAGLQVDSDLTAAIVADVQTEDVALPLLQYALTEVFEKRDENRLTLSSYYEIGGIAGALAHRADEIYDQLSEILQDITQQIFLRFVTPGEGTEDTRRRVRRSELVSLIRDNPHLQQVLDAFGKARLLTFDNDEETREPTVEIAHEALIREWGRLREWLDATREDIRRQRLLHARVEQWLNADFDNSFLLHGLQLLQFEDWLASSLVKLTGTEEKFVSGSIAEREHLEAIEREREEHEAMLEKQSRERLRYLLLMFAVATVIAGALSVFAFTQANKAREARDIALNNELEAEANRLLAEENARQAEISALEAQQFATEARSLALASGALREYSDGNTELALALALDSVNVDETLLEAPPELAYQALLDIAHAPGVVYEVSVVDRPIAHLLISPDGNYAVFGSGMNFNAYWNTDPSPSDNLPPNTNLPGGNPPLMGNPPLGNNLPMGNPPPGNNLPIGNLPAGNFSPSDNLPPVLNFDLQEWNLETREAGRTFVGHSSSVTDVVFTTQSDGALMVISASDNGQVIFWDYESGEILNEMTISAGLLNLSPSGDGSTLLVGANGMNDVRGTLALVDSASATIIVEYPVRDDLALARMTVSGEYIVALHLGGDLVTLDTLTGDEVMRTNIQTTLRLTSTDLLLSPDNRTVAVNTGGDTIPLFDALSGQSIGMVIPSAPGTHRVVFNDDGSQILAISRDGVVTQWDIDGHFFVRDFTTVLNFPTSLAWSSTHDIAIVTPRDGSLRIYSIEGEPLDLIDTIGSHQAGYSVWLNDTEILLGYRLQDAALVIWNTETREERLISDISYQWYSVSLSPDAQYAIIMPRYTVNGFRLINLNGQEVSPCAFCRSMTNPPAPLNAIFLNGQAHRLIVMDGRILSLLELETQTPIWQIELDFDEITQLVSSDDGTLLAVAHQNEHVLIFDTETGTLVAEYWAEALFEAIAFSPDNALLALASSDSPEVYLIDWQSGREVQELVGHDATVNSIEFLPDGERMVTASDDTSVILWDIQTGDILNQFDHDLLVLDVSVSPDGTQMVASPEDSLSRVWRLEQLSLEDAIEWAYDNRIVRDLTEGECARYKMSTQCQLDDDGGDD